MQRFHFGCEQGASASHLILFSFFIDQIHYLIGLFSFAASIVNCLFHPRISRVWESNKSLREMKVYPRLSNLMLLHCPLLRLLAKVLFYLYSCISSLVDSFSLIEENRAYALPRCCLVAQLPARRPPASSLSPAPSESGRVGRCSALRGMRSVNVFVRYCAFVEGCSLMVIGGLDLALVEKNPT